VANNTTRTSSSSRSASSADLALSPRDQEILKDIILAHVRSGGPVSSRAVSKHGRHQLSAATIRNVMADLEEAGLLMQPHTSAGRVPTEAAYRLYIESLMQLERISAREKRYIDGHLTADDADQLMADATHLLSELSHQVGVVLTPAVEEIVLKTVDFISVGGRKVLCVIVSTSGFVDHLAIETEEVLGREELVRISNYVTENFADLRLGQIRDRLLGLMAEERAKVDRWLAQAISLARRALGGPSGQEVLVEGTASLLDQPELADLGHIRRMLDTFADQARLVQMFNQCLAGEGVRVYLGEDCDVTSELDFGLVATSYGIDRRAMGSLGVIGPARMEYPRVVPLVHYLGEKLSELLTSAGRG
jgi:heat-inducible transcriptional repressor